MIRIVKGGFKHNVQTDTKAPVKRVAYIVVPAIHQDDAQPMGRNVWTVASSIISMKYAEAGEYQLSITWSRCQTNVR